MINRRDPDRYKSQQYHTLHELRQAVYEWASQREWVDLGQIQNIILNADIVKLQRFLEVHHDEGYSGFQAK